MENFRAECELIAEQCELEGYPANGSNYDLRCYALWKSYCMNFPFLEEE